jgi:hypothetical protein
MPWHQFNSRHLRRILGDILRQVTAIVYRVFAGLLVNLAVLSVFTGARTPLRGSRSAPRCSPRLRLCYWCIISLGYFFTDADSSSAKIPRDRDRLITARCVERSVRPLLFGMDYSPDEIQVGHP